MNRRFLRALPPALLAALATAAGAWIGARLGEMAVPGHCADMAALAGAIICAGLGYGAVVLAFRTRLPLGRHGAMRLFVALADSATAWRGASC